MRRSLTDERSHSTAEALALLGELGEVARQSMPGAPMPQAPSPAEAEPSAPTLPAAFTYARTNPSPHHQAPAAPRPSATEPGYTTRPEYQAALQDSSVIQALLALMPAEKPKPRTRAHQASAPGGFESRRPPNVEIEPKPFTPGRASSRNQSVFKLK